MAEQIRNEGGLLRRTVLSLKGWRRGVRTLCIPPFFIALVGTIIIDIASPLGVRDWRNFDAWPIHSAMVQITHLLVGISVVPSLTGWHRYIILGQNEHSAGRVYGWDRREWRYLFKWTLLWFAISIIFYAIHLAYATYITFEIRGWYSELHYNMRHLLLWATETIFDLILIALTILLSAFLIAKFGLMLPAAAIGADVTPKQAIRRVRGHATSVITAILAVWAFAWLLRAIVGSALDYLSHSIELHAVALLPSFCLYILAAIVSAGILSHAYADIDAKGAGQPD